MSAEKTGIVPHGSAMFQAWLFAGSEGYFVGTLSAIGSPYQTQVQSKGQPILEGESLPPSSPRPGKHIPPLGHITEPACPSTEPL